MGVTYAISCDKNAGVDVDAIQKHYLWTTGAKMLGFALLMVMAAVVVGYCASRVGAPSDEICVIRHSASRTVLQCRDGSFFNGIPDYEKYQ